MRLTLRTLLAYLDNILDADDTRQMGTKIDESEFATSLVHQIRGSVRRLRLDAPALDAQGVGGDLNSVAEYLDNVLPPEQVPALEKACLDSEINLGEVASCHQILTLVLGEAAPVTDTMRRKAYSIASTAPLPESHPPESPKTSKLYENGVQNNVHQPAPPDGGQPVPPTQETVPTTATGAVPQETSVVSETSAANDETAKESSAEVVPTDSLSTKETWRAEARVLEAEAREEPEENEAALAAQVVAAKSPAATVLPATSNYPDYIPRKSSWFRSAVLTAIVAILILAGLLFATGSFDNNLIAHWLGYEQDVTANDARDPAGNDPISSNVPEPVAVEPEATVEVVKPNQQQPELSRAADIPEFDNTPTPPAPQELPEVLELDKPSEEEELPEFIKNNGFTDSSAALDTRSSSELPSLDTSAPSIDVEAEMPPLPLVEPKLSDDGDTAAPRLVQADPVPDSQSDSALPLLELDVEDPDLSFNNDLDRATDLPHVLEDLPALNATNVGENSVLPDVSDVVTIEQPTEPAIIDDSFEATELEPPVAVHVSEPSVAPSEDLATTTRLPREPVPPAAPQEPTRLKRDDQLLLLFDETTKSWIRVDSQLQLHDKDHLLGLPAFKTELEIGNKLLCAVHGNARIQLGPNSGITLLDGNLVLRNLEPDQNQVVRFQGESATISMANRNSNVAVEAYHLHFPGADMTELPHSILRIHAIDYPISVELRGQSFDIPQGRHLLTVDNFAPRVKKTAREEAPTWRLKDKKNPADRSAIRTWTKQLPGVTDIYSWLHQRADRKIKVNERSLAARSLAEMDDFSSCIAALSDEAQHAYWSEHYSVLRRALTRGTDTQRLLQLELEKMHGSDQAELMMEMIRGYNEKQLAAGDAEKLVGYLDHPNLELRVLAILNLKEITGRTSGFKAADPLGRRSAASKSWRKALKTGRVSYKKNVPAIVSLLQSFADSE